VNRSGILVGRVVYGHTVRFPWASKALFSDVLLTDGAFSACLQGNATTVWLLFLNQATENLTITPVCCARVNASRDIRRRLCRPRTDTNLTRRVTGNVIRRRTARLQTVGVCE
jgi:hypothetical protein